MEILDPESHQIREVYAHFGLAIYLAQCVEQAIILNLIFFDLYPTAVSSNQDNKTWSDRFDKFEATEMKLTMGKLIKRLKNAGETTEAIELKLDEVVSNRNWLSHGYFNDRALDFTFEDGRTKMISELEVIQTLFREVDKMISEVTMPVARRYGLTEEMLDQMKSDMLTEHKLKSARS